MALSVTWSTTLIKLHEKQAAYLLLSDGCFWLVCCELLLFTIIYYWGGIRDQFYINI